MSGSRSGEPNSQTGRKFPALLLVVIIVGIVVAFTFYVLLRVPIEHTITKEFNVPGTSYPSCGRSSNFTTPVSGTFAFSWRANTTQAAEMYLEAQAINRSSTYQPYDSGGAGAIEGSGSVPVFSSFLYWFEFCGAYGQSASVSGTISYYSVVL